MLVFQMLQVHVSLFCERYMYFLNNSRVAFERLTWTKFMLTIAVNFIILSDISQTAVI